MEQPIRTTELVGAISLATDLGTGQPLEHALRTAAHVLLGHPIEPQEAVVGTEVLAG